MNGLPMAMYVYVKQGYIRCTDRSDRCHENMDPLKRPPHPTYSMDAVRAMHIDIDMAYLGINFYILV